MLHFITTTTILFLLHTNNSAIRAQLVFKRQVFGFDSSGRQLEASIDNNEDNSEEFLNRGMYHMMVNISTYNTITVTDISHFD